MGIFIDYFNFIVSKILIILDSMKMPNGHSVLFYGLGAIILGFIIKLVKGGTTEFEQNTNFMNGRIISNGLAVYRNKHEQRKAQLIEENKIKSKDDIRLRLNDYMSDRFFGGKRVVTLNEYDDVIDNL